jgi:hypothetical protein
VPTIDLFPTALSFASQAIGTTSLSKNIKVTNEGNSNLFLAIAVTGDFLEQNNCGTKLGIGKNCTIQVWFRPTTTGRRTGLITIKDNAPGNPQLITLLGIGQ